MRRTATLILALGLLAGCEKAPEKPEVATLASDPATAASPSPAAAERPLIRTDTSPEEEERLWDVYLKCLADHGYTKAGGDAANGGGSSGAAPRPALPDPRDEELSAAAEAACGSKKPEQVWERAKRTDPQYADKLHAWVTCIRAQGIDAWENDGFLAFKSLPPENEMKKVDECQDKAFGKG
ncbi:hypothetical protein Val02_61440 [Virgisporangium aliadipatigenens]|uniref:Lipoprotein n=1 Tax=Virgisporangium aliadipatigenens TaxID=741659 RepID=A0A8J4DTQ5_9ACTN|nr:hypothetical protein [Virgisporangium aliadipatigenens]GIJ49258.1 hypothetical protein Val02_61440 [Virgisporangium aliadipatigenens]